MKLAWAKKVTPEFAKRVIEYATRLNINPDWLMACMAFESGGTFSPSIKNAAGSGAVGLIQFMPSTAAALGTDTASLANMTAQDQLVYVYKYFLPNALKLRSIEDVYMNILWPAAIGKPLDYVLFDKADAHHPKFYIQNKGLDFNKDGKITKLEASAAVIKKLAEGLKPENCMEVA